MEKSAVVAGALLVPQGFPACIWMELSTFAVTSIWVMCFQPLFCEFLTYWGVFLFAVFLELAVSIFVVSAYILGVIIHLKKSLHYLLTIF